MRAMGYNKRMHPVSRGWAAGALLAAAMTVSAAESVPLDGIAAYVNDRAILIGDIVAMLAPVERQLRQSYRGEELERRVAQAWREALNRAVERALILEEFQRRGAEVPDRAVEEEAAAIVSERFNGNRAAFLDALAEERLSLDDYRQMTRESLAILLLRRQEVDARVRIGPREALDYYERNLDRYRTPELLRARLIVVRAGATEEERAVKRREAERLRAAAAGEDFGALAKAHSEGARAAEGGDTGWIPPTALRREIAEAAMRLAPGEISEILETPEDFFIVYLEGRRKASVRPFAEVREEIERALRRAEEQRLHERWIAQLRERHFVRILQPEVPE